MVQIKGYNLFEYSKEDVIAEYLQADGMYVRVVLYLRSKHDSYIYTRVYRFSPSFLPRQPFCTPDSISERHSLAPEMRI